MVPRDAAAFSVLAHQAIVDEAWQGSLVPLLRSRFRGVSDDELREARSYAYGGSHLADLGYFPLGSTLFSELLHYVRTGEFVAELLASAATPREYAFALGTLAHYEGDAIGHPEATNRAVAMMYPKLRKKHGERVTYADSPSAHLQTEFRFDILQVARRGEVPDLFDHSIEFQVPREHLERTFRKIYGIDLGDLFTSYDVALATYRFGFRALIDEATGIAWELYRSDIESLEPGVTSERFLHTLSIEEFQKQFGSAYRQPGYFARFIAFFGNVIPNVGPFKRLPYKPLPPEVREVYAAALRQSVDAYRAKLAEVGRGKAELANVDLDTGEPSRPGEYELADETAAELEKMRSR